MNRQQALQAFLGRKVEGEALTEAFCQHLGVPLEAGRAYFGDRIENQIENPKKPGERRRSDSQNIEIVGPITPYASTLREIFDEDATSARDVREQMKDREGDVVVRINSPGGSVSEVAEIVALLSERGRNNKVTTICMGIAASAGCVAFLAGQERLTTDYARFMIHRANVAMLFAGNLNDLEKVYESLRGALESFDATIIKQLTKLTSLSEEQVIDALDKDTWYNAEQALEINLATGEAFAQEDPEPTNVVSIPEVQAVYAGIEALENIRRVANAVSR